MTKKIQNIEIYQKLVDSIGNTIASTRLRAFQAVNNELLRLIGRLAMSQDKSGILNFKKKENEQY